MHGVLFKEQEPARRRVVDLGGVRGKLVVTTTCLWTPRLSRQHSLSPRLPAAPSLLRGIVRSSPQTYRSTATVRESVEEAPRGRKLLNLAVYDRRETMGTGAPSVALRRSARTRTPWVRLRRLPDHAALVVQAPRHSSALPAPPLVLGSPSITTTAQSGRGGNTSVENEVQSGAGCTGRAMTTSVPDSLGAPLTRRGCLPGSERAPERVLVERAVEALRDVRGLVRRP